MVTTVPHMEKEQLLTLVSLPMPLLGDHHRQPALLMAEMRLRMQPSNQRYLRRESLRLKTRWWWHLLKMGNSELMRCRLVTVSRMRRNRVG